MGIKDVIKQYTPWPVRLLSRRLRRLPGQIRDKRRSTREVFTEIYAENIWGERKPPDDKDFPYYSGPGSGEMAARPYAENINSFIDKHGIRAVVDLGCGDFRVGSRIARPNIDYTGVDIVEPLIQANQARFGSDHIRFRCLDIIADELPRGDLCLVREVLQHLSNSQIATILAKLKAFKWVIVTESLPGAPGSFKPNVDKPHGNETRTLWNSGVVLSAPPFNIANTVLLFDAHADHAERSGERISSFLMGN
jgi:SAM-dependent methyltransferase